MLECFHLKNLKRTAFAGKIYALAEVHGSTVLRPAKISLEYRQVQVGQLLCSRMGYKDDNEDVLRPSSLGLETLLSGQYLNMPEANTGTISSFILPKKSACQLHPGLGLEMVSCNFP